jgi:hypothetical protein
MLGHSDNFWRPDRVQALRSLVGDPARVPLDVIATKLGLPSNSRTRLLQKIRQLGISTKPFLKPKAVRYKLKAARGARTVQLSYPYINQAREEHQVLLAVNSLVPRGLVGREDVCQEIYLALLEQRVSLDELSRNPSAIRSFIRRFNQAAFEQSGYALSLDIPMRNGQNWHDILPAHGD